VTFLQKESVLLHAINHIDCIIYVTNWHKHTHCMHARFFLLIHLTYNIGFICRIFSRET